MDERKEIINRIISDQRQDGMLVEMANIRVDRQRNISIQINRREGLNAFYFKFYNHQDYERADKVCRISLYKPEYIEHRNLDGKKNWVLNSSERKELVNCLKETVKRTGLSYWEELIIAFNREKPGDPLGDEETMENTMDDLKYPDHLPIDLPMPNYALLR